MLNRDLDSLQPPPPPWEGSPGIRIAYILAEFPSVSETFILREILELRRQGIEVRMWALRQGRSDVVHEDAAALVPEVEYRPAWADRRIWQALAHWLARRPGPLLRMIGRIGWGTWRQPRLLLHRLGNIPASAFWARRMEELGLSHIHAHWAFLPTLVAWLAAELADRTFSFTVHAWDLFRETTLLKEKIAHASWVATCSEFNRRHLETEYPEEAWGKVVVAYHGLDLEQWKIENRKSKIENDLSLPLILSVGRLQAKKGFPVLVEACALLRERGEQFRCLIVGDGPERDRLQQMVRERCLSEAVTFLGARTQEELPSLYAAARAFALPCVVTPEGDRDGLPNAILEALAMSLPVVTTPISAIPEVIIDGVTGLLVPSGDAGALAQALSRLLADSDLRQRLGRQGRTRVEQQFDITRNVKPLRQRFAQSARPK